MQRSFPAGPVVSLFCASPTCRVLAALENGNISLMLYTSLGLEEGLVNVSGDSTLLFGLLEEEPSTRVVSEIQFVAYGKSGEGMFTATPRKDLSSVLELAI